MIFNVPLSVTRISQPLTPDHEKIICFIIYLSVLYSFVSFIEAIQENSSANLYPNLINTRTNCSKDWFQFC